MKSLQYNSLLLEMNFVSHLAFYEYHKLVPIERKDEQTVRKSTNFSQNETTLSENEYWRYPSISIPYLYQDHSRMSRISGQTRSTS